MAKIVSSSYAINLLDDLARKETSIHKLHPLIKLLTTVAYLAAVVSFGRYEISSLLPFVFYPVLLFIFADLPARVLKRILLVLPFIICIGILNPLFDNYTVLIGGYAVSRGWITCISIFIKGALTVTASILLIATTGMDKMASALRMLRIPKVFVLQLLLTYRYISILIQEVSRMTRAYSLRAPGQKGIRWNAWGSFAGQLILRTFERGQRLYQSMNLRGFTGEYNTCHNEKIRLKDFAYLLRWCLFFIIARIVNIPVLIESLFSGVIG